MLKTARTTLPIVLSTTVGLSAVTLMFVLPGEAAPDPTAFSAEVTGDVWRVNRLDLDMSGDPAQVDVAVGRADGDLGSVITPNRARGLAQNVVAPSPPAGVASAVSTATATQDTAGTTSGAGQAGSVPGVLDFTASQLTARGRWGGDQSCLAASVPLTASKSTSGGSGIVPAAIPEGTPPPLLPIPLPTSIPTEIPTELPSDFPTELPTDLPTILPTESLPTLPTESLPTLPTDDLTSILTILPTVTVPGLPRAAAAAAEGDVSMATVGAASVEELTQLQAIGSTTQRRVYAETIGKVTDPTKPVATFFGGEATLTMTGTPKLSAYSDGGANGSQVDWTPPTQMTLTVGGEPYPVPTDGTALALPYSQNEDVVLTVSAGKLASAESPQGVLAQAEVSVLDILIKNGDSVVLDAELFPMAVKAVAPAGGVDCTPVEEPAPSKPGLKLTGKNNGKKADKPVAKAIPAAAGAKATLFKVVNGKKKKLKSGVLNAKGDRAFKVRDKNGNRPTKYLVKITKTSLTAAAKATRKIR